MAAQALVTSLILSLFISLSAYGDNSEIKIGFVLPQSGPETAEGKIQLNALNLAIKQINTSGGINSKKVVLILKDNKSDNHASVVAFNELVEKDKVLAVFGPVKSPQVLAMLPAIKAAAVPIFVGATNPRITEEGNQWVFRGRVTDAAASKALVSYLKDDAHVEKIAILHDSDAFGSGGANMIAKFATEMGLKTVKREAYKTDQKDFKPYFEEFKAAGAQAMVIYTNRWPVLAQIEIQFKAFHAPFEIFGNSTAVQTTTLGVAKEAAEGVSAFTGFNIKDSEARRDFISAYKAEYKLEPDVSQSWPFDSMHILANAIAKGGEDRSKIRDAILSTKGYSGMMGTFDFDSRGDGLHEVSIVKVKSGVPSLLKLVVTGFEN